MRKSPTECRAGGITGRVSGVLCDRKMNVKIKGKVYMTYGRPTCLRGRNMGIGEVTEKNGGGRILMLRWMCEVTHL